MDRVDASAHYGQGAIGNLRNSSRFLRLLLIAVVEDKPSLLVVILDTNPYAWQELKDKLPLQVAMSHILLFLNSHLAFSHANAVAVIASHTKEAVFLYPNANKADDDNEEQQPSDPYRDANKYRLFGKIENEVQESLWRLLANTSAETLNGTNETMMAGALSIALAYINRVCHAGNIDSGATVLRPGETSRADTASMTARILVVSVSGDLANQYVSVMNSIFAAQRQRVPIDICKISGDTVFLQQASDSTNGIYVHVQHPVSLLQYLLVCILPFHTHLMREKIYFAYFLYKKSSFISDPSTRRHLIPPSQINVDFRAACFCHKKVVDVGFVCSICLSSEYPNYPP
jgi:transcription initiation factor TFIIH subunit 3